jgi:hypothetical protein
MGRVKDKRVINAELFSNLAGRLRDFCVSSQATKGDRRLKTNAAVNSGGRPY